MNSCFHHLANGLMQEFFISTRLVFFILVLKLMRTISDPRF